jgi:uncharacterized protein with GYD domain
MPLYMYQAAYTPESWAAQIKNPQNRVETVTRKVCKAAGGKLVGAWLCFGDYDFVIIADAPNNQSMAAIALAAGAGGAIKASKTTVLMTAKDGVGALKKAQEVAKAYKPAR